MPARRDDPAALPRDHPANAGRASLPGARTGLAVQGQALTREGSGRLRRDRPAPYARSAPDAGRADRPRTPRTPLASEPAAGSGSLIAEIPQAQVASSADRAPRLLSQSTIFDLRVSGLVAM